MTTSKVLFITINNLIKPKEQIIVHTPEEILRNLSAQECKTD